MMTSSKSFFAGSLLFVSTLVFPACAQVAPVSPTGGAVTIQPGAGPVSTPGTIQSQVPTTAGGITPLPVPAAGLTDNELAITTSGFQRFGDPMLESLIQLGLDNSPNLRVALSRLEEARIRVKVAQSFLSPSFRSSVLLATNWIYSNGFVLVLPWPIYRRRPA
jgi:multidrug efflux system outer membrane protein